MAGVRVRTGYNKQSGRRAKGRADAEDEARDLDGDPRRTGDEDEARLSRIEDRTDAGAIRTPETKP